MYSNLKGSVDKDKRAKKDIMPISKIDAEIMEEIMVALRNMSQDLLLSILNQYKILPDAQVSTLLKQFNIDYDPANYIGEDVVAPKFVQIGEGFFQIQNIISIERDSQWSYSTSEMQHRLIINKNVLDNLFLSNKIIFFSSLQQRELEVARLRKKLEMYNIKIL